LHRESDIVFKGLGNIANFGALMKQAQEMGGRLQAIQQELKGKRATGSAGGGLVEVDVNGLADVLAVRIDPSLVEKGEREMIEDLLPAAFGAAQRKAKELHAEALRSITGGLPMGGLQDALTLFSSVGGADDKT
jgi:nucleoid-associated protein EbfC